VASRFPLPPRRGDQARAFHQLRLLGGRHRITLVCPPGPPEERARLRDFCEELVEAPLRPLSRLAGLLTAAVTGRPLQAGLFADAATARLLGRACRRARPDVVHVQLVRKAPLLAGLRDVPRVADLVDALSLNLERRAARSGPLGRWLARLEARRLRESEREICRAFDRVTVTAPADREAIGDFPGLVVNGNGVDLERFPFRDEPLPAPVLVFTGNLGYFPAVDAVSWLAREVLPRVARDVPAVRLSLVGTRPPRTVRALAHPPGITLAGPVDDVGSHIRSARVALAPMRAGSGQLLKVLEAMASGVPVVATSLACSGIDAEPERHLLVADDADGFSRQVVRLLRDAPLCRRLGAEARRLVEGAYTWEASTGGLEAVWRAAAESHASPAP